MSIRVYLDSKRIGKPDSHRAAVKGARAARIQRGKMVGSANSCYICREFYQA